MKNQIKITVLLLMGLVIGCSKDDAPQETPEVQQEETQIALADLEARVDENSETGTLLGTFSAIVQNSDEAVTYSIVNQTPEGAVRIQDNSLRIANNILYDFETITEITGQVEASVEDVTVIANFSIGLKNVIEYTVTTVLNSQGEAAIFKAPGGMVQDNEGNIYVAETFGHTISKISADGTTSTLAGNGTSGFTNGRGVNASFSFPQDLTIDAKGDLYVTDSGNNSIRKITPNGDVTTLAGSGEKGIKDGQGINASFSSPYGIVWNPKLEALFVADRVNNSIRSIN